MPNPEKPSAPCGSPTVGPHACCSKVAALEARVRELTRSLAPTVEWAEAMYRDVLARANVRDRSEQAEYLVAAHPTLKRARRALEGR